ncbi:helicase-like protein [Streptomyces sp. 1114.5]|uniref:helicase-related protein n=1 Tax=Streptomyces sp. 1114.5 TaxID=1938830 RepID=UPI000EB275DD|nr:helicase-related protein [Streptomyces sp. 1114.5]RKT11420.1 helicase-like protein [Streptomyces sp. 1114.5]
MTDDHSRHYDFRAGLAERLKSDLLGPQGGADELLDDWPAGTYATGVLFPRTLRRSAEEPEDLDRLALDHDEADTTTAVDESPDPGVALARSARPSATGITFAVDPARSRHIVIQARAAVYEPFNTAGDPVVPERVEQRSTEQPDLQWRRRCLELRPVPLDVLAPPDTKEGLRLAEGLKLRLQVRPAGPRGAVAVTATLVNGHSVAAQDLKDPKCFFQVGLHVSVPDGIPALVERPSVRDLDDESGLTRLLYRHAPTFAVGHGCAADWSWTPTPVGSPDRLEVPEGVAAVWTEHVPVSEVLLADSNPDIPVTGFGMQRLAEASTPELLHTLREFVAGYEQWIAARVRDAELLRGGVHGDDRSMRLAAEQVERCRTAQARMSAGIDLLERDAQALEAFRLANHVMALQRGRGLWIRRGRAGTPAPEGEWRPFQLGFVLLCLNGIVDADHPERDIADLLWFPTGGGKTEAYLGLIAFTTFHRRLRLGSEGGGVTVLMRYTLRLLTLQQFERAALLICAMERVRARHPQRLGSEPISIGMWVGKAATPNTLKDAEGSLARLRRGETLQEENPVQLKHCPWCGTPLMVRNHEADASRRRMVIGCDDDGCDFADGLPVHVVDTEIYRIRPTLVIATADKFARVAWREDTAALFNRDEARLAGRTPPPELVIQDELHLISGPLGTLAGLYEAAVDIACARPKVIASTATIRRAQDQGRALFDRAVEQFPPSGLDARDSWFAVEAPADRKPSRLYVGLLAPGLSQATLLIRAYATLLHNAKHLECADDEVRDTYWTLLGYFNSLRLLGAAELQVHADVNERLRTLAVRDAVEPRQVLPTEITSRVPSSALPDLMAALGLQAGTPGVLDVALATNIISVGVDFDRLGLMAVTGQPQTTAEYIQATSRVGRAHPGLVVTLFNAARSRDLSHYEGFVSYHSALYRQVESTSVTPFSPRARDKALHAAFVGLLRLLHPETRKNSAANRPAEFRARLDSVREQLVERIRRISPEEADHADEEIRAFVRKWHRLAVTNGDLVYEAPYEFKAAPRRRADFALLRTHTDRDLTEGRSTLWSLRDVDVESHLYLES